MGGIAGGIGLGVVGAGALSAIHWPIIEVFSGIGASPEDQRQEWTRERHHDRGKMLLAGSALPAAVGATALLTGRGPGPAILGAAAGIAAVGIAHLFVYRPPS